MNLGREVKGFKNSKKQGDYGLGAAIAHFCSLGYSVCIPLTDSQDYDLVVEIDGVLKKVQVKTTRFKLSSGSYVVSLTIKGGNSKKNFIHKLNKDLDYDLLFVLCENGDKYLLPKPTKNSVAFGKEYQPFKI